MAVFKDEKYSGERALYAVRGAEVVNCEFSDGESPFKESADFTALGCRFLWRYPLWYCRDARITDCFLSVDARAPLWYSDNLIIDGCRSEAPKGIRRCKNLKITNSIFEKGDETLWDCDGAVIENSAFEGDYFALNSRNLTITGLKLSGKYSFDGCRNVVIRDSELLTKDVFWNSENITVYDSYISAEYLGWNSKNLTLVNCTVKSLQGMCFCDNLVMKNCRTEETTLAFEHSTVDAEIVNGIDSVFNPEGGKIRAEAIGELIVEKDIVNPADTEIICGSIGKYSDKPEWKR